jgi:hypothetical protein
VPSLYPRAGAEWLWIVNEENVVWPDVLQQRFGVGSADVFVEGTVGRRELLLHRAVDHVVDALGQREELWSIRLHHEPTRIDAEIAKQSDLRRQQLGDAAALGGRVHVPNGAALEHWGACLGRQAKALHGRDQLSDRCVGVEREARVWFDELHAADELALSRLVSLAVCRRRPNWRRSSPDTH